jgi:signal transduction histidine kinase
MNRISRSSRREGPPTTRAGRARRAERRLEDSLVALLGHELRTPINGIQSSAELLVHYLDDELDGDMARLVARRVLRLSIRLGLLIQDLYEMARISSGSGEPARELIDPLDAVAWAIETVESAHRTPPIVVAAPTVQLRTVGNVGHLGRAIVNLLTNGAKHAPQSDRIDVRIYADEAAVSIDVEDYGPGIPSEDLDRIFAPYCRANRGHATGADDPSHADGLGLGLFIADRIVAAHGGSIGVVSTLGLGTRFTISLPRAQTDDASAGALPLGDRDRPFSGPSRPQSGGDPTAS